MPDPGARRRMLGLQTDKLASQGRVSGGVGGPAVTQPGQMVEFGAEVFAVAP
jgi:hypothetical protein